MRSRAGLALVLGIVAMVAISGGVLLGGGPGRSASPAVASQAGSATPTTSARPTPTPVPAATSTNPAPVPTPKTSLQPFPKVAPSRDSTLDLAGWHGIPGLVDCGTQFVFDIRALDDPTGAEDRVGAEYDALREFFSTRTPLLGPDPGLDPGLREVARYPNRVAFLMDRVDPGPWSENGGPFLYVYFNKAVSSWLWAGSGDCTPRAYGPVGYFPAQWELDPAFGKPNASSRVIHILVSEFQCSSGRTASGRIGPAYVVPDRYEMSVEILVKRRSGDQDCQGVPPTPATVRLPEPLGDRNLRDTNENLGVGIGG
jgi:hypothetical protein